MPFFSRPRHNTAVERRLVDYVHAFPATTRSSTKIVIRSIPVLLTTIHTNDWKQHIAKKTIC
jgi:hypothetical protein